MSEDRDTEFAREEPWWLQPGPESCDVCLGAVHYEALVHCSACDRPLCPACAVTVFERRIVLCPDCAEEA